MNKNIAKHQKFKAITINRQQIKNAPYNPRKISDENYKKLKRNVRQIGLVETLVWNKSTGNLVSGHQRLRIMDELEKRPDYDLTVAMVEMDEKTEKEQNIFLNNSSAQGEWDRDLMMEIIPEIELGNTGFSEVDLSMIGVEFDLENHQDENVENVINQFEKIKTESKAAKEEERKQNPEKKDWKEVKKDIKKQHEGDEKEDYVVITFSNSKNKAAFMERFGFHVDDRYIKGEVFEGMIERVK